MCERREERARKKERKRERERERERDRTDGATPHVLREVFLVLFRFLGRVNLVGLQVVQIDGRRLRKNGTTVHDSTNAERRRKKREQEKTE